MLRTGCLLAPQRDFVVTLRRSGLPYRRPPATALLGHYAGRTLTGKFITAFRTHTTTASDSLPTPIHFPVPHPRVLAVVATPVGMRVLVARFFRHMISENVQVFWAALQRGEFITDAAEAVGTYRKQGARWVVASGGVRPRRGRNLQGRYLCFAEREEIALARAAGDRCGRSPRGWGAPRRRSRGSWAVTPSRRGGIGPRARTRRPGSVPRGRNRRSWRRTWRCGGRLGSICRSGTRRSRSPAGCGWSSPTTRRCGCPPRRSISRCMCSRAARCAVS